MPGVPGVEDLQGRKEMKFSEFIETPQWLDNSPEFVSETETTITYKIGNDLVIVDKD